MSTTMPEKRAHRDEFDACIVTPFSTVGIVIDGDALTRLQFLPPDIAAKPPKRNTLAHLVCVQVMAYLDNPRYRFDVPLRLKGSKHQIDVWHAIAKIESGHTAYYGDIAAVVGSNARAVGTACGQNPVPLIIACHRVVATTGLGGFMGGKARGPLDVKRWLLAHEGVSMAGTVMPTLF
jgi:methylated-DNA-[protein]-cysteine S-methyltransferase